MRPAPARPKRSAIQLNAVAARVASQTGLFVTSASAEAASSLNRIGSRLPNVTVATSSASRNAAAVADAVHSSIGSMLSTRPVTNRMKARSAPTSPPVTANNNPKLASITGCVHRNVRFPAQCGYGLRLALINNAQGCRHFVSP